MNQEMISTALSAEPYSSLPVYTVETALASDYDRTLGNVERAMDRLCSIAGRFPQIDTAQIKTAQATAEADGGSFNPLGMIERMTGIDFPEFRQQYQQVRQGEPELLYSDATLFLKNVRYRRMINCVLTYGANPVWQSMKIAASGYKGHVETLNHTRKGPVIASWQNNQGKYVFLGLDKRGVPRAVYHANQAKIVDDKTISLEDLPASCQGFYIQRAGEKRMPSQGDAYALPPNNQLIRDLAEVALDDVRPVMPGEEHVVAYRPVVFDV